MPRASDVHGVRRNPFPIAAVSLLLLLSFLGLYLGVLFTKYASGLVFFRKILCSCDVSFACTRFRDRLKIMGTLDDLTLACSDVCCDGLKNPREHVMMKLFPGLKKWPLADAFHKVQIGTDSMVAGHEYYADAARYVWRLSFPSE